VEQTNCCKSGRVQHSAASKAKPWHSLVVAVAVAIVTVAVVAAITVVTVAVVTATVVVTVTVAAAGH
jgi:hypothetical protein